MKISLNWLRDYINLTDLSIDQIAEIMTDTGLEVEGIEQFESITGGLEGLVVGQVESCEKHENADRLKVCQVTIGSGEPLQIVCGAPNVAQGQKVVVAPVNTTIYPIEGEPFKIKKAKIRGVQSSGMLCAEDEIGIGQSHDGILILPEDTPIGQPLSEIYEVYTDTVFEIGLTPNRSDAQSHIGVARDLSAAISTQSEQNVIVKWPATAAFTVDEETTPIQVQVENSEACARYAGLVISGIEVKASPLWLQNRLLAIGVRPINNIVDVTNYINHEYGQPLHAFDYNKILGNEILVKDLPSGTKFKTLDGVERILSDKDLMICNKSEPMCLAGVYGGLDTGVTEQTKAIFLESAYFDPKTIRRTELRHNLKTDAAAKFEKGVDPTKQVEVLKRSALLIEEIAGGRVTSRLIDLYPNPIERKQVKLSFERLNQLTGIQFEPSQAVDILNQLDFEVLQKSDLHVQLAVPQYRADVTREADVIEEILRIYGFNNVPTKDEVSYQMLYHEDSQDKLRNTLSDMLSGKGFHEIITNSITRQSYYDDVAIEVSKGVKPLNSINANLNLLRPDMVMTGLEVLAYNNNRSMPDAKLYDFGKIYSRVGNGFKEENKLALYLSGQSGKQNWVSDATPFTFFNAKQSVEEILIKSGIRRLKQRESTHDSLEYGLDYCFGNQSIVSVGALKKAITSQFGLKQEVYFATIDFDYLLAQQPISVQFKPISKFPSVSRDLALILDKQVSYQEVEDVAQREGGQYLQEMDLFDIFMDESKLGTGKKSYAIELRFQNVNDTLTSETVDKDIAHLIKAFEQNLKATIRK